MANKNVNSLDEMFFEQFEELTDEELMDINGGSFWSNLGGILLGAADVGLTTLGNVAEGMYGSEYYGR